MGFGLFFRVFTVVSAVSALKITSHRPRTTREYPPPPSEYPPETGRPKNMNWCRINANTISPWVVGVWDRKFWQFVGHGSLITHIAFVTSCRNYETPEYYSAIGQFVWNISLPEDPCEQEKVIANIYQHPKCTSSPIEATFFDFAVMKMGFSLAITGTNYPTISLPISPFDLLIRVQYVNLHPGTIGCKLTYFRNQNEKPPVFVSNSSVESIPFYSKCVHHLCEKIPLDPAFSTKCQERFGEREKGTVLCVKNKNKEPIHLGSAGRYWYAGAALVCNSSAIGIAAQAKIRKTAQKPNTQDIHFVLTFLRVWSWLIGQKQKHSAPWAQPFYIEDLDITPSPHSDAHVPAPSLRNFAIVILACHSLPVYLLIIIS